MTCMTMMNTKTTSMIAAAEVWTPLADESGLELAQGLYGGCEALSAAHAGLVLPGGEGLAGQAWSRQVPLVVGAITEESFASAATLRELSIGAAMAMPIFDHGKVTSVLVLYFHGGEAVRGGVEIWAGRRGRMELGLVGAYHPGLDRFAHVSRYVNFPMGSGLPGQVWQYACPQIMEHLASTPNFMRSSGAETEGLSTGFGLPIIRGSELKGVVALLSTLDCPVARVYEVWQPTPASTPGHAPCLSRIDGAYSGLDAFEKAAGNVTYQPGEGLLGKAWASRRPELMTGIEDAHTRRARAAAEAGLSHAIAIPIIVMDEVRSVALLAW